jgi:hypothetical protein
MKRHANNRDEESDNTNSEYSYYSGDESEDSEEGQHVGELDIDPITFFSVKEKCYYRMINKFFKTCTSTDIAKMINIVEGKSTISLRILDWFVTKYSRKRIDCGSAKDAEMFDVRISYKSQLKSYKKQYFDPFRRKKKFNYNFDNGLSMKTTLGQLNFFKWAFMNNIIGYVDKNLKQISKEIKVANKDLETKKDTKSKKSNSSDKKPTKVTKKSLNVKVDENNGIIKVNATKSVKDGEVKLTLTFD